MPRALNISRVLPVLPWLLLGMAGLARAAEPVEPQILGWAETAWLTDPVIKLQAKLDTGADTSSLHAHIIKKFRRGGKRMVRFEVEDPVSGEKTVVERPRLRTIGIVQHEGENEVRPVVPMDVCVSGVMIRIEVSLTDRGNFTYPLLIGRRSLKHFAIVDPGHTFLGNDACWELVSRAPPSAGS
jgi:hypothetical protein